MPKRWFSARRIFAISGVTDFKKIKVAQIIHSAFKKMIETSTFIDKDETNIFFTYVCQHASFLRSRYCMIWLSRFRILSWQATPAHKFIRTCAHGLFVFVDFCCALMTNLCLHETELFKKYCSSISFQLH